MNTSGFTQKQNELIESIIANPYETTQRVYAMDLGVDPSRVCHLLKQIREKYTPEEFRDLEI